LKDFELRVRKREDKKKAVPLEEEEKSEDEGIDSDEIDPELNSSTIH